MKKILLSLAAMVVSVAATAQTVIVENTFHKYNGMKDASLYQAVGVAVPTAVGTVDGYWQGVRAWGPGYTDRLNGFEVGYGGFFPVGTITLNPRVAYGHMGNINVGGSNVTAKYALYSLEATKQLGTGITGFASVSHRNGVNQASLSASNRVQLGADIAIAGPLTVRIGGSLIRELGTTQRGLTTMVFYSF